MSDVKYRVLYYDPWGNYKTTLEYQQLTYARKFNEEGSLSLNLKPIYPIDYFEKDGIIEVWRSINNTGFYLDVDSVWFIKKVRYATEDSGIEVQEIQAFDGLSILKRKLVAYDNGSSYTSKMDYADDMIKEIARENMGDLVFDTNRDLSNILSFSPITSQGALITKDVAWGKLLNIFQEISEASEEEGIRVIFDIQKLTGSQKYILKTFINYSGKDRGSSSSNQYIASLENGNLSSPELIKDWTEEVNYSYALGPGGAGEREVQEVYNPESINASPLGRSEEKFDARNSDTGSNAVLSEAKHGLISRKARLFFSGRLVQNENSVYGLHYKYGDVIVAKYKGYTINCVIDTIAVMDSDAGESVEVGLFAETYL